VCLVAIASVVQEGHEGNLQQYARQQDTSKVVMLIVLHQQLQVSHI
jgi:hypothetical protein